MSDLRSKQRDLLAALLQANRPESSTTRTVHTHQKDRNELSLPSSTDGVPQGSETWKDRRKLTYAHELPIHTGVCRLINDAQTGMLPGYPESAICVQRFDDSLNSAIHTTYRNWLRSSSMHEPRDPPLEVVTFSFCFLQSNTGEHKCVKKITWLVAQWGRSIERSFKTPGVTPPAWYNSQWFCQKMTNGNDPSAGSPTETLLRLLLPLNDQV